MLLVIALLYGMRKHCLVHAFADVLSSIRLPICINDKNIECHFNIPHAYDFIGSDGFRHKVQSFIRRGLRIECRSDSHGFFDFETKR